MSAIESQLLRPGALLRYGQYRIERYLNSGGFGITYLAYDTSLEQPVVIKEFFMRTLAVRSGDGLSVSASTPVNAEDFERHRKKFRKEAQRIHNLNHRNIVRVDSLFDENDTTYYAMEFVPGGSLADRLQKEGGRLDETYVRQVLDALLDALGYIHSKNLWHLDIKPANILLRRNGEPVLIDFGASKYVTDDGKVKLSTASGVAFTEGYAPSEQVHGIIDDFGPWTDFYALGATLYKLLTGVTPPPSYKLNQDPSLLRFDAANVSPEMQYLIGRLMAHNHLERPKSAEEVRALLGQKHQKEEQTETKPKLQKPVGISNDDQCIPEAKADQPAQSNGKIRTFVIIGVAVFAAIAFVMIGLSLYNRSYDSVETDYEDSCAVDSAVAIENYCPDDNHPHEIDLGLPSGTKWACCNVGASCSSDYGSYISWGETEEKSDSYERTYCYGTPDGYLTKYCNSLYDGKDFFTDQKVELELEDDIARDKWGGTWRIPSQKQIEELIENTTYEWTTLNGVNGGLFTSKSNGNSVFLPAAGLRMNTETAKTGRDGAYWSSNLCQSGPKRVECLAFDEGSPTVDSGARRWYGVPVRPVCP